MRRSTSIDRLRRQVRAAARAGVDLVHVRERDLEARELEHLVRELVNATRGSSTRIVVNDRFDVAVAAEAAGVHLRADGVAPARVRPFVPPSFLIGRSIHDPQEVDGSVPVDYFVFGSVFSTRSKRGSQTVAGLTALAEAASRSSVPVLAIGGMTLKRVPEVAAAGAGGMAAIGLFADPPGDRDPERAFEALVAAIRAAFS